LVAGLAEKGINVLKVEDATWQIVGTYIGLASAAEEARMKLE
jgi:hypothetical protein